MYYILNEKFSLCGYKGLPFGLRFTDNNNVSFFDKEQYEIILKLDGETDINTKELSTAQLEFLNKLLEEKVVEKISEPISLKSHQNYILYPAMYKKEVQWSITGECNYRCRHCFMSAPDYEYKNISKEECINFISQMADCGIKNVSLTGGEPLVSSYLFEIIAECSKKDINISTISTNGALVDKKLVAELKKYGMKPSFHMSFDGTGWHDWLRGIEGAEKKVADAFLLLKEEGFITTSAMSLHKNNLSGFNETIRFLDSLGVSHLKSNICSPAGLWANEKENFLNRDDTYEYLIKTVIPQFVTDNLSIGVQFCGILDVSTKFKTTKIPFCKFSGNEECVSDYSCDCVKYNMYISPEGYVLPCMAMVATNLEKKFDNLKESSLSEILSGSNYTKASLSTVKEVFENNEKCLNCKYKYFCGGGCRAEAAGEHGTDYFAIDDNACHFFLSGWYDKTIELQNKIKKQFEKHNENLLSR